MKLWVDDIRNAPDETWTVARTVGAAIRAIAMFGNDMEVISLDHDISHQVTIGTGLERPFPCEETFEPVAWFMAFRYSGNLTPKVILHTSNVSGARKMHDALVARWETDERIETKPMGLANRLEMEV